MPSPLDPRGLEAADPRLAPGARIGELERRLGAVERPSRVRDDYARRAQHQLIGGGLLAWDGVSFRWPDRFIVISQGGNRLINASYGSFSIDQPPAGTVITGVGGAANATATANGVPIAAWTALYYILPLGGTTNASVPGNFRLVGYTADVDVPAHWIRLALESGDDGRLWVGGGVGPIDYKRPFPFNAGWTNYGGAESPATFWRSPDGMVYAEGRVYNTAPFSYSGTNLVIGILPARYRPLGNRPFITPGYDASTGAYRDATGYVTPTGEVRVYNAGPDTFTSGAASSWLQLDAIYFRADH